MVVFMVTLYLRVSMRRSNRFSAQFSLLKSGAAAALALATILSCSDSTSPTMGPDGVTHVRVTWLGPELSDSAKEALALAPDLSVSSVMNGPMSALSRNVLASASVALSTGSCGGGTELLGYEKSKVAFSPLEIPRFAPDTVFDDKYMANMPIGFNFTFYGKTYDKVNIFSNGLLMFGAATTNADGYAKGALIPSSLLPNNIIAFAWSDWSPQLVQDGIRYETRGSAPNRKYIVQFTNVPEFATGQVLGALKTTSGRLMVQVVLSESSNDITIYTNTMSITNSSHKYTQGIENADGTDAKYDSIFVPSAGVNVPRRALFFAGINLSNDAVRFSLPAPAKDVDAPSIAAPADVIQGNDLHLASAVVAVGSPVASDNCSAVTVSSVRSDGAAIDAPYPVGVTTITWSAKDVALNSASAIQTVTVEDREAPIFGGGAQLLSVQSLSVQSSLTVNANTPAGAVVTFDPSVWDNVGVVSRSCEPASGSVFSVGSHDVTCAASDAAGNVGYDTFSVLVVSVQQQVESLMDILRRQGNGTAQPLMNQLKLASKARGNKCNKMDDFMHLLSVKASNISNDDMDMINESARDIMGALGCDVADFAPAAAPDLGDAQPRTINGDPLRRSS
jgi:hypothetical protein